MQIITEVQKLDIIPDIYLKYFDENTLLFDIECTGLSPKSAFVYLIGCAYRNDNEINYIQFFADGYEDEKTLLNEFSLFLDKFENIVGYNSTRFDEPFLIERFNKYAIENSITSKNHKDLYLTTTKAKVLLNLANYKQKSIEQFLDLFREDMYNGGELIPVYNNYTISLDEESKKLVLLHNLEDVKGMVHILEILNYVELFNVNLSSTNIILDKDSLHFTFNTNISIPKPISKARDYGIYLIKNNTGSMSLKVVNDTLMTFLNDYKNYYYLINENIIIPKVIGSSIDKSLRRNATKKDCAVSQHAVFVQMPNGMKFNNNVKVFKKSYDDENIFLNINDINEEILNRAFIFMLKH